MNEFPARLVIAERRFTRDEQFDFVRMTGDANPVHADEAAAAAMFTGGIIVHGVHGIMWSLDAYLRQNPDFQVCAIQANFLKPILLERVVVASAERAGDTLKLKLTCENVEVTTAKITAGVAPTPQEGDFSGGPRGAPPKRELSALPNIAGQLKMAPSARELAARFPALSSTVGPTVIAGLGSLATLVGMECPGLYGISTGITVNISSDNGPLNYHVKRVDPRFSHAEIAVSGYGLTGTIAAFVNAPKA